MFVNLTATFGAGNEPTKEQCDLLFAKWQDKKSSVSQLPVLRKIGDVADTFNPATGEYVQRIGKYVFTGNENFIIRTDDDLTNGEYTCFQHHLPLPMISVSPALCSSFIGTSPPNKEGVWSEHLRVGGTYLQFITHLFASIDELTAYLAAQHTAGTPVTVYYQLAKPIVTYLEPATVPTYYPYTRLEPDGAVKGTIEATVKVIE